MADPLIPGGVRAQVILDGVSGLPEDRFVTTYAFGSQDGGAASDAALDTIAAGLEAMWTDTYPGGTNPLDYYLGPVVNSPARVNLYRLGDDTPREPTEYTFAISPGMSAPFPNEVALCLSFFATRNLPRRRGRIYFGPTGVGAQAGSPFTAGDSRPVPLLMTTLLNAGKLLRDYALGLYPWAVLSQVDGQLRPVTDLWVDNAWDTQRRRGVDPSTRFTDP
jgi:hypothetical protein